MVDVAIDNYMREQQKCQREELYDSYRPRVHLPELEALWQEAEDNDDSSLVLDTTF